MSSLENISQIISIPFIPNKEHALKFLSEVYHNILIRSNNVFNVYTFQEIINIPMIIAEKVYLSLNNYSNQQMSSGDFTLGLYSLLFSSLSKKIEIIFSILDFDNDSMVNYSDIFLILSHFHMIDNGGETIDHLKNILEDFIEKDEEMDKEVFFNRCKHSNCDTVQLMIYFINKYLLFFEEDEIKFFGEYCYEEYYEKDNNNDKEYNSNGDINESKEMNFQMTQRLQKYFDKTDMLFKHRKSTVINDKLNNLIINRICKCNNNNNKDSNINDDEDDFDELNNFENDLANIMNNNPAEKEPSLFNIHSSKTFDCNSQHLPNQNFLKRKDGKLSASPKLINHNNISRISKLNTSTIPYHSCFTKSTNDVSTNEDSTINNFNNNTNNKLRTSCPSYDNINHSLIFPEFILIQGSPTSNIQCKLVITHSFCFLFTLLNNQSIYSKTLPLNGLFCKSGAISLKKGCFFEIKLISNIHNHIIEYFFYTANEENTTKIKSLIKRKNTIDSINDKFTIIREVGRGKFGQVYLIEDKMVQEFYYAMKTVKKNCSTEEEYKINRWESSIFLFFTKLKHPNIIECLEYYETDENVYYIFEYMKGGDLKTYIKSNTSIPSEIIVDVALQIINGVSCLHQYGIIHRDIKTTNILIERNIKRDEVIVKLIDFGLSRILGAYEKSTDPYGSLSFKAPELLLHMPYAFKVDIWAVGITIYYLIFRSLPYEKGTKQQIKRLIIQKEINYPLNQVNSNLTSNYSFLFALIGECLEKNMNNRPDITHIMQKYYEKYQLEEETVI